MEASRAISWWEKYYFMREILLLYYYEARSCSLTASAVTCVPKLNSCCFFVCIFTQNYKSKSAVLTAISSAWQSCNKFRTCLLCWQGKGSVHFYIGPEQLVHFFRITGSLAEVKGKKQTCFADSRKESTVQLCQQKRKKVKAWFIYIQLFSSQQSLVSTLLSSFIFIVMFCVCVCVSVSVCVCLCLCVQYQWKFSRRLMTCVTLYLRSQTTSPLLIRLEKVCNT